MFEQLPRGLRGDDLLSARLGSTIDQSSGTHADHELVESARATLSGLIMRVCSASIISHVQSGLDGRRAQPLISYSVPVSG